MYDFLLQYKIT